MAFLTAMACLLAIVSCESRRPIGLGEAISYADDLQQREGLWWGSPIETLPPTEADQRGHRWWQLRYAQGPGSTDERLILVDASSGWAQRPEPGYARRIADAPAASSTHPMTVRDGPWILLLTQPADSPADQEAVSEREAARLNALGTETGMYPLFSVRTDRQGRFALVYGWQGDRGIQRDERISHWIHDRTPYGFGTWVDLDR